MIHWHQYQSAKAVAHYAADRITCIAKEAIDARGVFKIVLAGGSTPAACYRMLAGSRTDWSNWQVYFGDERCLPVEHPDRNSVMADECLLSQVPVKAENTFVIPAEAGAERGAERYQQVIDSAMPFDVVMLGMGEDGHTASLFPGQKRIDERSVIPVYDAPKPPADRISLNYLTLQSTRHMLVLITGAGKQSAMGRWFSGGALPICDVVENTGADIVLDQAAYSGPLLIDV
ncbi:MAG: 6-phosphogluconolactonase [Gammaproteobacteria bacterium]